MLLYSMRKYPWGFLAAANTADMQYKRGISAHESRV